MRAEKPDLSVADRCELIVEKVFARYTLQLPVKIVADRVTGVRRGVRHIVARLIRPHLVRNAKAAVPGAQTVSRYFETETRFETAELFVAHCQVRDTTRFSPFNVSTDLTLS